MIHTILITACLLFGVAVLVLARNRWIQNHPLRACVVLSIAAHVLLAVGVLTTNILQMPALPPGDGAITVKIEALKPASMSAAPVKAPVEPAESVAEPPQPPPNEEPADNPVDQAVEEIETAEPRAVDLPPNRDDQFDLADDLPVEPEPPQTSESEPNALAVDSVADAHLNPLPMSVEPSEVSLSEPDASLSPVPPLADDRGKWKHSPRSAMQPTRLNGKSSRYAGRSIEGRERETILRGGSAKTEAAVVAALQWLASVQESDGRWSARKHAAGRGGFIEGQVRGTTGANADTGVTALALLALLAHGETPQEGRFAAEVALGLRFLQSSQRSNGDFGGRADVHARMYCHGMSMLAMAEAYAMTEDPALLRPLQRAISYSVSCQDRYTGGWRYRPGEPGDTSQFGWQVMALTSASRAGVRDGDVALSGMHRFLNSVSSGSAGGLASYRPGMPPTRSMTAEALVCRWCLGSADPNTQDEASNFIMQQPPGTGPRNFYYWYYGSLALCQLDDPNWPAWNRALQRQLLRTQRRSGKLSGSWDPNTMWGPCGGRVYTTAIATLCLEVYYRYAPRADDMAKVPG